MKRIVYLTVLACLLFTLPAIARAAKFPENPIRIICPFGAGDAIDNTARVLAERMRTVLGVSVVVQNIAGGGGALGIAEGKKAAPDGYTLVIVSAGAITAGPLISNSGFMPSDFIPLAELVSMPIAVAVGENSPYKTMADLVEAGKSKELSFSTPGASTKQRISMTAFAKENGLTFVHIAGKSGSDAATKAMTGEVDFVCVGAPVFEPLAKAGKLRVLAVGSEERVPYLPDTPTFKELGYTTPDQLWFGLVVRKEVPADRIAILADAVRDAAAQPETKALYTTLRYTDSYLPGPEFAKLIESNIEQNAIILKDLGLIK